MDTFPPPPAQPVRSGVAVETALSELRRGRPILLVDDKDRENEGDLIMAAEFATSREIAFMIRHTTGLICAAVTQDRAARLGLPLMVADGDDAHGTAFTVSVDLKAGTSSGVSAADRASTIRALADPLTDPADLSRPGHVLPLRAHPGGVLARPGHTEGAVDLCRLAGLHAVGALAEVINDDGTMARRPELERFAAEHGLVMVSVEDVRRYRRVVEHLVRREADCRLPSEYGEFTAMTYRSLVDGCEHVALVMGDVAQADEQDGDGEPVLVRVHSECLTGDVFTSRRCDCREQLITAMAAVGAAGRGVIVYLRGHEGRGIGLSSKLRAYGLQDDGFDTVDANLAQGLPADARDYTVAAQILRQLGVRAVRLMTNNPAKCRGLEEGGIRVAVREPSLVTPNPDNVRYLRTKQLRMDHQLGDGVQVS